MSNITKAFDKKASLRAIRMADGGLVGEAKKNLGNRAATIDGAVDSAVRATPAPAPAPAPAASAPAPQSEDAKRAAVGMPPKKGFLRTMLGMAAGGHVTGPGGPREDKVPAMLSNGEYVLPAKTVQKLGGPEEIDELVRATNDGREPEGAEERDEGRHTLRKLAGGGFVGPLYPSDPRYIAAQNRAMNPSGAGMQSSVQMDQRLQGPQRPIGTAATPSVTPTTGAPAQTTTSQLRTRGGLGASYAAPAAIAGAVQSYNDIDSGYRDQFNKSMGAETPLQTLGADALRTMGNVGNAITGGYAGKLGQGISSAMNGGTFMEGFSAPTDREAFLQKSQVSAQSPNSGELVGPPSSLARPATTAVPTDAPPSPRNVAQSRFLSEQGVDAATQASAPVRLDIAGTGPNGVVTKNTGLRNVTEPGKFVNLGSFLGPDNIYGTSSKPGGRVDSFVGAGDPNRQESPQTIAAVEKLQNDLAVDRAKTAAREQAEALASATQGNAGSINARFDEMARGVKGSYSAKGKGNESKRLLDIETQRANALEADARNMTTLRGHMLQAQSQAAHDATQNRQIETQERTRKDALRAQLAGKPLEIAKFNADREKLRRDQEEKGDASVNEAIKGSIARRFPDAKDPVQAAGAERFAAFMREAPPEVIARIRSQNPTEREAGLQLAMNLFDQNERVSNYQADTFRGISTSRPTLPKGDARRVELGDYVGPGSLPLAAAPRYVAGIFGADAGKVQEMESGAKVPLNTLTQDEFGNTSATRMASLQAQRELQRKNEERARIERLKQAVK